MFTIAPHLAHAIMLAGVHKVHSPPHPGSSQPGGGAVPIVWLLALLLIIAATRAIGTVARAAGALMSVIGQLVRAAVAVGAAFLAIVLAAAAVIALLFHH